MSVSKGQDALRILRAKQPAVNLVLTGKLFDMCRFQFVEIVGVQMGLAVLMICDADDRDSIKRGLSSGAMLCIKSPVELKDIEYIWQFPVAKQSQCSIQQPMTLLPRVELLDTMVVAPKQGVVDETSSLPAGKGHMVLQTGNGPQGQKKTKMDEIRRADGWSVGQSSSSFTWTPDLDDRFFNVLRALGPLKATPSGIIDHMNAPGLTTRIVAEKLKQLCRGIISAGMSANANDGRSSTIGHPLIGFLKDYENQVLLKGIVHAALSGWKAGNPCCCRAPSLPLGSILDGLGRAFDRFIDQLYAEVYPNLVLMEAPMALQGVQRVDGPMALPGGHRVQFQNPGPSVVQQAGPLVPSVVQQTGPLVPSVVQQASPLMPSVVQQASPLMPSVVQQAGPSVPSVVHHAGPSAPSAPQGGEGDIVSIFVELISYEEMLEGVHFLLN